MGGVVFKNLNISVSINALWFILIYILKIDMVCIIDSKYLTVLDSKCIIWLSFLKSLQNLGLGFEETF